MNDLSLFFNSNVFSMNLLHQFCEVVFCEEKAKYLCKQIYLHIQPLSKNTNGALVHLIRGQYHILINPIPFRKVAKESPALAYFYLYTTILHEFHHIELHETKPDQLDCLEYNHALMLLEDYPDLKGRRLGKAFENILSLGNRSVRKKKYAISATELACNCESLRKALARFQESLPEDRTRNVRLILSASEHLCNHIEIAYSFRGTPYSRFVYMVKAYSNLISKNPNYLEAAPYLRTLFTEKGEFVPVQSVYQRAKEEVGSFYTQVLFQLFLYSAFDFTEAFNGCEEMRSFLEELSNHYIKETIAYFQSIHMEEILVEKEIIEDNAAMKIKNVSRLQALMKKYKMNNTAGSVYPLYVPS